MSYYVCRPQSGIPPPNEKVTGLENEFSSSLSLSNLDLTEQAFPQRPGFGSQGNSVVVWANFVELLMDPTIVLYTYGIKVKPKAAGKKLAQILKLLLDGPDFAPSRGKLATDFRSTLVSTLDLPNNTYNIRYRAEEEDEPDERARTYDVEMKKTNSLAIADFLAYLDPTQPLGGFEKGYIIQALNILLNHFQKSDKGLITIGSRCFPIGPNMNSTDLGQGLQAIRGFYSSVRAATGRILVNVNVSYGVFFQPGSLHILMNLITHDNKDKHQLDRTLKKLSVIVTHLSKTNKSGGVVPRIKRIFGLASPKDGTDLGSCQPRVPEFGAGPKQVEFWFEDQKRFITVYDFFKVRHGIALKSVDLPVINVGTKDRPTYLPPEVCNVCSGESAIRIRLGGSQTTRMLGAAVHRPFENAQTIVNTGLRAVGLGPNNALQDEFQFKPSSSLITAHARVLVEPQVLYGQKSVKLNPSRAWNLLGQTLAVPATIKAWDWLVVHVPALDHDSAFSSEAEAINTLEAFQRLMNRMGIKIGAPTKQGYRKINLSGIDDPLLDKTLEAVADNVDFLCIILQFKTPVYDRIKHLCDVKLGLVNVCCIGKSLRKNDDQYFANVALKINAKCGGRNQSIAPSRLHLIAQDKTMVVGIDVTHPSPGSVEHAPSIAGMVASIDRHMGQWPSVCRVQRKARQEMVDGLDDMLKSRLYLWKNKGRHAYFPENIIVFRDGVSEGQYQLVNDTELPLLQKACNEVYSAAKQSKPRITVVIVTKRHHKRLYPTREANADNGSNCKPGTVIDRGITEARSWDFYIVPHTALKGTAKPTYYFVVHDEIFRTSHRGTALGPADTLQDLTQSLSYISARSTKPVSICAPVDYADLVCERARCYLSRTFDRYALSESGNSQQSDMEEDEGRRARFQKEINLHKNTEDVMVYL